MFVEKKIIEVAAMLDVIVKVVQEVDHVQKVANSKNCFECIFFLDLFFSFVKSSSRHSPDSSSRRTKRSRSPMSSRRRHVGNREDPPSGRCLGIFGLSIYTQERDLKDVFSKYGPIEDVQIVYDAQTGRSRGFAFIYFEKGTHAVEVKR